MYKVKELKWYQEHMDFTNELMYRSTIGLNFNCIIYSNKSKKQWYWSIRQGPIPFIMGKSNSLKKAKEDCFKRWQQQVISNFLREVKES